MNYFGIWHPEFDKLTNEVSWHLASKIEKLTNEELRHPKIERLANGKLRHSAQWHACNSAITAATTNGIQINRDVFLMSVCF